MIICIRTFFLESNRIPDSGFRYIFFKICCRHLIYIFDYKKIVLIKPDKVKSCQRRRTIICNISILYNYSKWWTPSVSWWNIKTSVDTGNCTCTAYNLVKFFTIISPWICSSYFDLWRVLYNKHFTKKRSSWYLYHSYAILIKLLRFLIIILYWLIRSRYINKWCINIRIKSFHLISINYLINLIICTEPWCKKLHLTRFKNCWYKKISCWWCRITAYPFNHKK